MTENTDMHLLVTNTFKKKGRGIDQKKLSESDVTTTTKHVWWICRPGRNCDIFCFQELCTDPCDMGPSIFILKHGVMEANEWHDNGPQYLVTVSLCIQIDIDKMQLCSVSVTYACPYHNPTATMGHCVHNVNIRKPLAHTTPYTLRLWGWLDVLPNSLKQFCVVAYGREINISFSGNSSGGHSCNRHANYTLHQFLRHQWFCVMDSTMSICQISNPYRAAPVNCKGCYCEVETSRSNNFSEAKWWATQAHRTGPPSAEMRST